MITCNCALKPPLYSNFCVALAMWHHTVFRVLPYHDTLLEVHIVHVTFSRGRGRGYLETFQQGWLSYFLGSKFGKMLFLCYVISFRNCSHFGGYVTVFELFAGGGGQSNIKLCHFILGTMKFFSTADLSKTANLFFELWIFRGYILWVVEEHPEYTCVPLMGLKYYYAT